MLLAADQRRVRYVQSEVIDALEKECKEAGGLQPEIQGGLAFIYPGTKWCGPGNWNTHYKLLLESHIRHWNPLMRFFSQKNVFMDFNGL